MKNILSFPGKEATQETAAHWLAKIHRGEMTREEKDVLHDWLDTDQKNADALLQMTELWSEMDALSLLADLLPSEPQKVVEKEVVTLTFPAWVKKRVVIKAVGIAATVMLMLFATLFFVNFSQQGLNPVISEPVELVYQTKLGEQSQAELKDGSTILLNTQSKVRVRYSSYERAVELIEGEAHFTVAKNPEVPFVVYAGNGQVRAVGTAFSVRVINDHVGVTVSEGTVEVITNVHEQQIGNVSGPIVNDLTTITLTQGGVADYGDAIESYTYIEPQKLEQKLAWKSGKWIFEGESLEDVIAEANRYIDKKITIIDPKIAGLRVGGYFDVGDVEPLLKALEKGMGVVVIRGNAGYIQLAGHDQTLLYSQ